MSIHPTSKLSPRDIACVRYGKWLNRVLAASRSIRNIRKVAIFAPVLERREKSFAQLISKARAARARIFRDCYKCEHFARIGGIVPACVLVDDWFGFKRTKACTCPHYKERRVNDG